MKHTRDRLKVKTGSSNLQNETDAVRDFAQQIAQNDAAINIFFASSRYNLELLGQELQQSFKSPVIGCTTSGEITPQGYAQGTITGFSLASDELQVYPYLLSGLNDFDTAKSSEIYRAIEARLSQSRKEFPEAQAFGVLLIDGLSVMEEQIIAILANAVGEDVPIVGGSAGDDFNLKKTHIYSGGKFISDAALFTLFITTLPFVPIKTQHFKASENRMVITQATPEQRVVQEINGKPAAEEYARIIGVRKCELNPVIFSEYPVLLRLGGEYYVRSIQKMNDDDSLTFFCAIDEGLVLRIAKGEDIVANLEQLFKNIRKQFPEIKLTLGFDCILRLLEVKDRGLETKINEILRRNQVIGFNTYGEQFNSVHVNQTFTGIVLGE